MLQLLKVLRQSTDLRPVGDFLPGEIYILAAKAERATESVAGTCIMRFWKLTAVVVLTGMFVIPALADITKMRLFRIGVVTTH